MSTIVHTCSNILIRPNGIVRYINAVIDLQKSLGHEVIFITDATPTQTINADRVLYANETSTYIPNIKDGHVWLQVDSKIPQQIKSVYKQHHIVADLVIAHDIHGYLGLAPVFSNGIFIQHESDVLTAGSRYSFLSDEYLAQQIHICNNTTWRIGLTVTSDNISPPRAVFTPMPFVPLVMPVVPKTKGLLYIGDTTERKGAKEFMDVTRTLNVVPTVITHDPDPELFAGADIYTFTLDQKMDMYALMSQHKAAFISSKNECPGLVVLECLQFMPVVVDSQYNWTKCLAELDVILATGAELISVIEGLLTSYKEHNNISLQRWGKKSIELWTNLST